MKNRTPRISVIGAGPGGLLCARVLQRHGIEVTVHDADASPTARDAGGTLDLHADTGQIALETAGLLDAFRAVARIEGQAKRTLDQHGTVLAEYLPGPDEDAAPEIDRGQLRELLAGQVRLGTVRWGRKLVGATPLGGGAHRLRFADGATEETDLVIGADGAWSRVRPLLTGAVPVYSGVSFLDVRFEDVDTRHPEIAELVGDGHMFANGRHGRAIIGQRNSNGVVRGLIGLRTGLDWHTDAGVDLTDTAAVRRHLLREFDGWAAELLPFITEAEAFGNRALHALPAPLAWEHTAGATLLGDAAHLMSPFGGYGMNLALLDGAELARALAEEADVDTAVARYESVMLGRSGPLAVGANQALDGFFADSEPDPADIPDQAAAGERYKRAAAEYRLRHAMPTPGEASAVGGWTVTFRTPGGTKRAELVLHPAGGTRDGELTGTLDGRAIEAARAGADGAEVTFTARLTSPFPMTARCTAAVTGDAMSGTIEAATMSLPFTATRQRA